MVSMRGVVHILFVFKHRLLEIRDAYTYIKYVYIVLMETTS